MPRPYIPVEIGEIRVGYGPRHFAAPVAPEVEVEKPEDDEERNRYDDSKSLRCSLH